MRQLDLDELRGIASDQPFPLLFSTVSGAHLYGFASVDSDIDLRGVHLLPVEMVVGLTPGPGTVTSSFDHDGAEIDLVTHDLAKFAGLLLRRNGYVLEQLLSPLVVTTGDAHRQLIELAPSCLTRHHARHYLGFAATQWSLFTKTRKLKPLLYTFRVLLTGLHLMTTAETVAHLPTLIEAVDEAPGWLGTAMVLKGAAEDAALEPLLPHVETLERDMLQLVDRLQSAFEHSDLPDAARAQPALHELLVSLRMNR